MSEELTTMPATRANMVRYAREGLIAYSPHTGEQYSATPGDYWDLGPNVPLCDAADEPMILARVVTTIEPITGDSYASVSDREVNATFERAWNA